MKILKETGNYLKEQAKINKNTSYLFFAIGGIGLLYSFISQEFVLLYIFLFILGIGGSFFKKYLNYSGGHGAEKIVVEYLQNLDDKYYMINDIKLPNSYGNIDHILLGPNGIFVIETKNYEGQIRCDGDLWYQYKPEWKIAEEHEIKSPSKQVKGNALRLKNFIDSSKIFKKPLNIWIDGIVVFTNGDVELNLNNPTVTILKIDELYDYIKNKKSKTVFSSQELESIGKSIIKQIENKND